MSQNEKNISWPGWEVVRPIGRGSFGTVYEIQRDVLGSIEKAALKVISIPQNASDIDEMYSNGYDEESITNTFKFHLKNIVEEYSLMRKLSDCSSIVTCDDVRYVQHDDGIGWDIFIKMELLTPLLKSIQNPVSEDTVVKLAKDICAALVSCKQYNIVHRDIKPQNIFFSPSGIYKLGDFGIAKTVEKTMGGTKVGTYNYMAPEVYHNKPYGSAADIYSLGLVLYWLLNERRMPLLPLPPVKLSVGMDEAARTRRLSGEQFAEPKNGSRTLKAIVMKACAYNVEDRYASASEMLTDLNQIPQEQFRETVVKPFAPDFRMASITRMETEDEDKTVGVFQETVSNNAVIPDSQLEERTVGLFFKDQKSEKQKETERILRERGEAERQAKEKAEAESLRKIQAAIESKRKQQEEQDRLKKRDRIRKIAVIVLAIVVALLLVLWPRHTHIWEAATCDQPKTCQECGKVADNALGHQIIAASCEFPEHCTLCGKTFGKALDHVWQEATISLPETCSVCSASRGISVGEQIILDAQEDAEAGRYRQAIQTLDQAWQTHGDQSFFDQAAAYRMEFGMYANYILAAGKFNSILLGSDGNPRIVGDPQYGELLANNWSDIIAVSLGDRHVLGLDKNGNVWSVGKDDENQLDVYNWENVVAISAGDSQSIALLENGRVVSTTPETYDKIDTHALLSGAAGHRIVAISAGWKHALALLDNGRVVGTGYSGNSSAYNVNNWTNIAAIVTGTNFSAGLRTDGTVYVTESSWNVSDWKDIVALAAGDYFLLGLRSNGTVVSVGGTGKPDVSGWRGIVCIAAGHDHAVAIDSEGYVHNAGSTLYGQYFASGTNIND